MQLARFARRQRKFRGFNFREWFLTGEKRENKSLAKLPAIRYIVAVGCMQHNNKVQHNVMIESNDSCP